MGHGDGYLEEFQCDDFLCQWNCRLKIKEDKNVFITWDKCQNNMDYPGYIRKGYSQKMFCWPSEGVRGDRLLVQHYDNEFCDGKLTREMKQDGCHEYGVRD